jgi:peptidoglycan/LPS O-acetylase OafA/YrhL
MAKRDQWGWWGWWGLRDHGAPMPRSTPGKAGKTSPRGASKSPYAPALPYAPGLDGLRALAVAAVLLYHSDVPGFPGGFLGVDVFFVLSGFLITSVLLVGARSDGKVRLGQFWARRARRLLPALVLVLGVTCMYTALFLPNEAAKLRGDVFAALSYVTNWQLIFGEQSYFAAIGRPSMVQHLWSLAVEEQFYLVWPLLFAAGLKVWRDRPTRLVAVLVAGAALSALLMALMYDPLDPSRVHYGTDTHASGLLIGAALAMLWPPWRLTGKTGAGAPILLDIGGIAGLVALIWCFKNLSEFSDGLYRGGYLIVAVITALVVAVAVHPAARVTGFLLGNRVLRWIGVRSYGIYLWHWPVYLVTRPRLDIALTGWPLLGVRVAITVTLAALSYRYVEAPIRAGAMSRAVEGIRTGRAAIRRRVVRRVRVAVLASVVAVSLLGVGMAMAEPVKPPPGFPTEALQIEVTTTTPSAASAELPTASPNQAAVTAPTTPPTAASAPTTVPAPAWVTAVGDSVMLGAHDAVAQAIGAIPLRLQIDASVSRQFSEARDLLGMLGGAGQLGDRVVIHLGTNGVIRPEQLEELLQLLHDVPRVLLVNANVPRVWEQEVNDTLAAGAASYPNAKLVDWKAASAPHPEYFVDDGVHLTPEGAAAYAQLITSSL